MNLASCHYLGAPKTQIFSFLLAWTIVLSAGTRRRDRRMENSQLLPTGRSRLVGTPIIRISLLPLLSMGRCLSRQFKTRARRQPRLSPMRTERWMEKISSQRLRLNPKSLPSRYPKHLDGSNAHVVHLSALVVELYPSV